MKSVIYIMLAFILVVPLVGCGEKEDPEAANFDRSTLSDVGPNEMPERGKGGSASQEDPL